MEKLKSVNLAITLLSLLVFPTEVSATLTFGADVDARYQLTNYEDGELMVKGLGSSLRKVFADDKGDRLVLFAFVDLMDNFHETTVEQAYAQYKGPMGRWNVTVGRYIVPFGLLTSYLSERLLIKTLEHKTIGERYDSGLQVSGVLGDFDYALSVSGGTGTNKWLDFDKSPAGTFRIGYQGADFEDLRGGVSGFIGSVLPDMAHGGTDSTMNKQLLALDLTKYSGPMVVRAEITTGAEEGKFLLGGYLGADYAILPRIDLNLAYTHMTSTVYDQDAISVGVTYNLFPGFQMRVAQKFSLKEDENVSAFQIYNMFTYTF